jgi:tyrosine-protein kinase Etk/Wzc
VGQPLSAANIAITIADIQAKPGTQFTITQQSELEAIDALQLRFSVSERSKDSGMLGLTITGEDPDEMARVLNCIADNYLQQNVARQAAQDAKSLQFLKQQLPQVRSELTRPGEAQPLSPAKRLVDLNLEAKAVLEQIVNADNQLNELTFREAEISQLYKRSPHLPGAD